MFSFLKRLFKSNNEAVKQALLNGAQIIDVRTNLEFAAGHIAGSKNIPLDQVKKRTNEIRKWNKPVVTVCRSGSRSSVAKGILQAAGIEVYNGGAWTSLKRN